MDEPALPPAIAPHIYTAAEIARVAGWIDTTRVLTAEGLIRPPVGDIAEILVAWAVRGTRVKLAAQGWDVEAGSKRIQVRGLWRAGHRRRGSLGAIPKICDSVVAVAFEPDLSVAGAWELINLPAQGTRISLTQMQRDGKVFPLNGAEYDLHLTRESRH
jgi:hypothetical protein